MLTMSHLNFSSSMNLSLKNATLPYPFAADGGRSYVLNYYTKRKAQIPKLPRDFFLSVSAVGAQPRLGRYAASSRAVGGGTTPFFARKMCRHTHFPPAERKDRTCASARQTQNRAHFLPAIKNADGVSIRLTSIRNPAPRSSISASSAVCSLYSSSPGLPPPEPSTSERM